VTAQRAAGDHFSAVARSYAQFRPRYPRALFEFVASLVARHARAWDCGAGTGQATLQLAEWFDEVCATDVSPEQIARAPAHPRVRWQVAAAESSGLRARSADLVTVAQALHWFDHRPFYDEVRRVAAPHAAIAAWTYGAPVMEGAVGASLTHFARETLRSYWPPERRYVDDEYRTIPFPFERVAAPRFELRHRWDRSHVLGYTRTWSATVRYQQQHDRDPVRQLAEALETLWPNESEARAIVWPLIVVAGKIAE
jgi:ubiquinone/menaquinone biosynthesis C-methylase UbiE